MISTPLVPPPAKRGPLLCVRGPSEYLLLSLLLLPSFLPCDSVAAHRTAHKHTGNLRGLLEIRPQSPPSCRAHLIPMPPIREMKEYDTWWRVNGTGGRGRARAGRGAIEGSEQLAVWECQPELAEAKS